MIPHQLLDSVLRTAFHLLSLQHSALYLPDLGRLQTVTLTVVFFVLLQALVLLLLLFKQELLDL